MKAILDLIFPPLCPSCHTIVPTHKTLCPPCWQELTFIAEPFCFQCGLPFDIALLENTESSDSSLKCAACLHSPPAFSSTRAVYVYNNLSKKMILSFKHGKALHLAPFLAQGMWNIGKNMVEEADLIIPVPLHWRRLYKRGFNQAALLGQNLSKFSKKPVNLTVLKRIYNTPSQGDLSLEQRIQNVGSCFKVTKAEKIKDKVIVLVDDVMTTGATLNACARILLKEGAKEVRVLCAARVPPS